MEAQNLWRKNYRDNKLDLLNKINDNINLKA